MADPEVAVGARVFALAEVHDIVAAHAVAVLIECHKVAAVVCR